MGKVAPAQKLIDHLCRVAVPDLPEGTDRQDQRLLVAETVLVRQDVLNDFPGVFVLIGAADGNGDLPQRDLAATVCRGIGAAAADTLDQFLLRPHGLGAGGELDRSVVPDGGIGIFQVRFQLIEGGNGGGQQIA